MSSIFRSAAQFELSSGNNMLKFTLRIFLLWRKFGTLERENRGEQMLQLNYLRMKIVCEGNLVEIGKQKVNKPTKVG